MTRILWRKNYILLDISLAFVTLMRNAAKKNPPSPLQIAEWVYICMQVGRVKRKQDGRLGLKTIRKQSLWFGRMSWLQREKDYSLEKYHEETNAEGLHAH